VHVNLCLANHDTMGRQTLLDQVLWVTAGLEENGHSVSVSEEGFDGDCLNLVWECFPLRTGRLLASSGIAYGIVATEIPDGAGFNHRRDKPWPERWNGFRVAASQARFIWCLVETAVEDYRRYAPAAYLELGFTERLVPASPRAKPSFDFSFAGAARSHRKTIIDRLSESATVTYAGGFLDHAEQLDLLRQGRVALALKQSPEWKWASPARVGRLVHERIPVAQEWVLEDIGVTHLVPRPAQGEDFVRWTLEYLQRNPEAEAERAFEAYRQVTMRECMARAMDLTL
jgi:hypothetical protein